MSKLNLNTPNACKASNAPNNSPKHIHILGICGTFMAGIASIAKAMNFRVTGSDKNVYPPMSTQLAHMGIEVNEGYEVSEGLGVAELKPNLYIIGNVMRRGMPIIEYILDNNLPYMSGPEWLYQQVLSKRHVLAVSGTHGKTTTSSMLAWILECAGLKPGFLIGGIPNNFNESARLGEAGYFVIEADEYDCAFFDKRSKFVHYRPRTLIFNNLEYDHADIFPNLEAIKTQFHHLIRTIPKSGVIIYPEEDKNIQDTLKLGCYSETLVIGRDGFYAKEISAEISAKAVSEKENSAKTDTCSLMEGGSSFQVYFKEKLLGTVNWALLGQHNIMNGLAAIAAAYSIGVLPANAILALNSFKNVKRRMELKSDFKFNDHRVRVFDDFAHHPTAIQTTLEGLKNQQNKNDRLIAVLDIRSNTMRMGHHQHALPNCFDLADTVFWYKPKDAHWDVDAAFAKMNRVGVGGVYGDEEELMDAIWNAIKVEATKVEASRRKGSRTEESRTEGIIDVLVMSNGGLTVDLRRG